MFEDMMQEFDDLCLRIRHAAELAEAAVEDIHLRIGNLNRVGYLGNSIYLGEQIWHRPASDLAECDDLGFINQPALWTWQGYGIVNWDSAEFLQFRDEFRLEWEARNYFKAFGNCTAFEKALILRDHEQMLNELRKVYQI
jgi:hypothetical protein